MKIVIIKRCALAALAVALGGCATIVSKSSQTITITSVPPAAALTVVNGSGTAVHSGATPATVTLKKGRGYFKPEHYTVRVTKEGFQPQELHIDGAVNGWYYGNIVFGGLIGMLAVDPNTGAMFTLKPKQVDATLSALKVSRDADARTLTVMLLENVPREFSDQLIPLFSN
jgi:hypothetical protein